MYDKSPFIMYLMCVNWFIDAKCCLLCVVCLSAPAFSLHRWIAQQWVKRKQSASVFLVSTYPRSRQALCRAIHVGDAR